MNANEEANHSPYETYRSVDGRARLTFHPEWDKSQPWVGYIDGTAGRHYATLSGGKQDMKLRGHPFL